MKQCPDNETLTTFLDYSLDDDQNNFVIEHIQECSECRDKIETMIKDEKELFTALFDLPTEKPYKDSVGEKCPQMERMWSYAEGDIQVEQQVQIEEHLHTCDDCLNHFMEIQKELLQSQLEFDTAGVLSAIEEAHSNERTTGIILELIIKIGERSLEVIRYTGELIVSQPRLAVRGGEQKEKSKSSEDTVCIRKDFEDTGTSVAITVRKGNMRDTVSINVSVMNIMTEEFLEGILVSFSQQGQSMERITDRDGEIEFIDILHGEYILKIVNRQGQEIGKGSLSFC